MLRFLTFSMLFLFASNKLSSQIKTVPSTYDSLQTFLKIQPKDTLYVWAMRPYILKVIYEKADLKRADSLIAEIGGLSEKLNYGRGIYFHYLLRAIVHNQKTEAQLSIDNFQKCLEIIEKYKLPPSLLEATLNNLSIGYEQLGNRDKALEFALKAIKVQEQPSFPEKWLDAAPYGTVSIIYKYRKQFEQAEKYAQKAFDIAAKKKNFIGMAINMNKLGNIYDDQNKTLKALKAYEEGLVYAEKSNYMLLQTDLLSNLGRIMTELKRFDEAEKYLKKSELICKGLESPKALSIVMQNLGILYEKQGKNTIALKYYETALQYTKQLDDFKAKTTAATSLAKLNATIGNYPQAYKYLELAKATSDSLFTAESEQKMQEFLTKYETEKKEVAIKQLETEKQQANTRLWWISGLSMLLLITFVLIFKNYQSKQKIEAIQATQKLRNRLSADLHDEIGSTLSSISILSEMLAIQPKAGMKPEIMQQISHDARKVIDKIDEIIWSINPNNDEFLNLEARLKSYAIPMMEAKNIDFSFQFPAELKKLNIEMEKRRDTYLILKEAINNAIKHSRCKRITVTGEIALKGLKISIRDDGQGFDMQAETHRNGLKNMRKRAEVIGGKLSINAREKEGTEVILEFQNS